MPIHTPNKGKLGLIPVVAVGSEAYHGQGRAAEAWSAGLSLSPCTTNHDLQRMMPPYPRAILLFGHLSNDYSSCRHYHTFVPRLRHTQGRTAIANSATQEGIATACNYTWTNVLSVLEYPVQWPLVASTTVTQSLDLITGALKPAFG